MNRKETKYSKVDFREKQRRTMVKTMLCSIVGSIVVYWVLLLYDPDISELRLIVLVVFLPLVAYFWYRFLIHQNEALLFGSVGMSILPLMVFSESLVFVFLCIGLGTGALFLGIYYTRKITPLFVYPSLLATAEQDTDEYMNGYSPRPAGLEFGSFKNETMKRFTRLLLRYELLWGRVKEPDGFTLYLRPAMDFSLIPPLKKSYVTLHKDGKAEVFITQHDYDYLKVPISYHLLCEKVALRLRKSYELFAEGNEKAALEVFRVEDEEVRQ